MKRKFWSTLEKWSKNDKKKPLIVIGARQTGKTYIIEKYCKENYKNFCYINLFQDDRLIDIFETYKNFDDRVEFMSIRFNVDFNDKDTILFVDEVQESEEFIESLKLFCESGMTNIICAGSLLGVKLKRFNKSYPVGKVEEKILYPMDFEEFLIATNNEKYISSIKESFIYNKENMFHKELLQLLYKYLYLGGMPEMVQNYISNNQNLSKIDDGILSNISSQYIKDMNKFIKDTTESLRIETIYDNIAPQLLKENPKFMYAKFDKKDRKSDYISALDWLTSSKLVLKCNQLNKIEYPIKLYEDNDNYKLYLSDVGLLRQKIGVDVSDVFFEGDYKYKGLLAENYVATELLNQFSEIQYWSRKGNENNSKAEVDFVIQVGSQVIPIEVKSGNNKSQSLKIYNEKFKPNLMIKIANANFGVKDNIKTIPLYATFLIKECLEEIYK